jgi:hypothetical protein
MPAAFSWGMLTGPRGNGIFVYGVYGYIPPDGQLLYWFPLCF